MPSYMRALLAAQASFKKGEVYYVQVAHDHDCGIYSGKDCGCSPDITATRQDGKKFSVGSDGSVVEAS